MPHPFRLRESEALFNTNHVALVSLVAAPAPAVPSPLPPQTTYARYAQARILSCTPQRKTPGAVSTTPSSCRPVHASGAGAGRDVAARPVPRNHCALPRQPHHPAATPLPRRYPAATALRLLLAPPPGARMRRIRPPSRSPPSARGRLTHTTPCPARAASHSQRPRPCASIHTRAPTPTAPAAHRLCARHARPVRSPGRHVPVPATSSPACPTCHARHARPVSVSPAPIAPRPPVPAHANQRPPVPATPARRAPEHLAPAAHHARRAIRTPRALRHTRASASARHAPAPTLCQHQRARRAAAPVDTQHTGAPRPLSYAPAHPRP
ncbi:hypothetical protein DENSPDRAFT_886962 [Dentipellis sp. KUC8613]|nr:hypothetical protein DENSPDRAFT_886962 [Dentipellis sp. KUC8613]